MFIDRVELTLLAGNGGAGCSSFRREKFVPNGGPDGGDGGKGGDVVFVVKDNTNTLASYRGKRQLKAQKGQQGMGRNKTGKQGECLELIVPPGTQVIDVESGSVLLDLVEVDERVVLLEGGKGGLGNTHFKNSRRQAPTYAQPGIKGESLKVRLELKLIADVGLVGFPNVGKSTLIAAISNAKPEIANYEFTTLVPNLGIVDLGEHKSIVMADIPGIIEGASDGKGLGLEFLRHIQRTKVLLYVLDVSNYRSLQEQFLALRQELERYASDMLSKPFAIALSKSDTTQDSQDMLVDFLQSCLKGIAYATNDQGVFVLQDGAMQDQPLFVIALSAVAHQGLDGLMQQFEHFVDAKVDERW